jgi:protein-S-isoprenylcysteine O-methyltransferase Ste14
METVGLKLFLEARCLLVRHAGWVSTLSVAVMMMGFVLSLVVMKQNRYSSRVVEIQENQVVIDTGIYSVIRHPMYLSAILIFCPIALILGAFGSGNLNCN